MNTENFSKTVSRKDEAMAKRNILPCHQSTLPTSGCFKRIKEGIVGGNANSDGGRSFIVINLEETSHLDPYDE